VNKSVVFSIGDNRFSLCTACLGDYNLDFTVEIETKKKVDKALSETAKTRLKTSKRLEEKLAKRVGGKRQPGSGNSNLPGFKSDVRKMGEWRFEHKYTNSLRNYDFRLDIMSKLLNETSPSEKPALVVEFAKLNESFAIMPLSTLLELLDEIENNKRLGVSNQRRFTNSNRPNVSKSKNRRPPRGTKS
jgi:hypothetical protein